MEGNIASRLYNGWFGRVLDKTGTTPLARRAYRSSIEATTPDTRQFTINGTTIRFRQETFVEWRTLDAFEEELPVVADLCETIQPSDVVWDVGANLGAYACAIKKTNPETEVVAFEPVTASAANLRENAERNDVDIDIREVAVSDTDGEVPMQIETEAPASSRNSLATCADGQLTVESVRADTLIQRDLSPPTVLKVDVEGAEGLVIDGAPSVLSETRLVYLELHHGRLIGGWTGPDIRNKLTAHDYTVETLHRRGNDVFLRATQGEPV